MIDDLLEPLIAFRRDIHAHPELGFCEHRTAGRIAEQLRALGLEVHEGIGGTGVVAVLKNGSSGRSIGLRADMDALPIHEQTNLPYASKTEGSFHGCGHDGHVAMLLGAAQHLTRSRHFDGTVNFFFQPAEEGLGGAREMVKEGLFDRFPCDRVFGLHNWPDLPAGTIATRPGPIMGAADKFEITLEGRGGHAAIPQDTPDAILASASLVSQLNTIVARRIPATSSAVLSVTQIHGGHAHNVIPATVKVVGTVRTFDPKVQDIVEDAIRKITAGVALANDVMASVDYDRYYPATINDEEAAQEALTAAATVGNAQLAPEPAFTSEDFAFMLQACKGAYIWLGQAKSEGSVPLHNPHYDFNDDVLGLGIRLHVALVEQHLSKA
ncbi:MULTISPECIES: M20 aminoacylase family protein [unclassified Sphingobium]|uniref:M20 aminoacylase family protein n=1 Tax=unclassified Sphingobium TaxID=2611147 RepID=UPI00077030D8|nr:MULTISPECIES: M20 aminoacylase family protein [unclassified Sphingobium]AMK23870.1 hippurate hydrolase [Sphingobium sp. TKS]NML89356.1 amidohydrolase [Sphingobium sp. TB-6]